LRPARCEPDSTATTPDRRAREALGAGTSRAGPPRPTRMIQRPRAASKRTRGRSAGPPRIVSPSGRHHAPGGLVVLGGDLHRRCAGPDASHGRLVEARRLISLGSARRCPSRPSTATSSLRNRNGDFVQTRTSRTQRPYPRLHFGRRPSIAPSDTRMAPRKTPCCRMTQRLRVSMLIALLAGHHRARRLRPDALVRRRPRSRWAASSCRKSAESVYLPFVVRARSGWRPALGQMSRHAASSSATGFVLKRTGALLTTSVVRR
jgi:hypothetical protein